MSAHATERSGYDYKPSFSSSRGAQGIERTSAVAAIVVVVIVVVSAAASIVVVVIVVIVVI